ncbi:hypothetical protein SNEBB_007994 [Seison nebaliae]|nr:hypothetical protein SNEBB_007994 [Seison nebaliae]
MDASTSVIIRLKNLSYSARTQHIRQLFRGLNIPNGGVHVVGGREGNAFIAFVTREDAEKALRLDGKMFFDNKIRLYQSSMEEMQELIPQIESEMTGKETKPISLPEQTQRKVVYNNDKLNESERLRQSSPPLASYKTDSRELNDSYERKDYDHSLTRFNKDINNNINHNNNNNNIPVEPSNYRTSQIHSPIQQQTPYSLEFTCECLEISRFPKNDEDCSFSVILSLISPVLLTKKNVKFINDEYGCRTGRVLLSLSHKEECYHVHRIVKTKNIDRAKFIEANPNCKIEELVVRPITKFEFVNFVDSYKPEHSRLLDEYRQCVKLSSFQTKVQKSDVRQLFKSIPLKDRDVYLYSYPPGQRRFSNAIVLMPNDVDVRSICRSSNGMQFLGQMLTVEKVSERDLDEKLIEYFGKFRTSSSSKHSLHMNDVPIPPKMSRNNQEMEPPINKFRQPKVTNPSTVHGNNNNIHHPTTNGNGENSFNYLSIANVPRDCTNDDICRLLSDYQIANGESVHILETEWQCKRQTVAFIHLILSDDARNAQMKLNRTKFGGRIIFVDCISSDDYYRKATERRYQSSSKNTYPYHPNSHNVNRSNPMTSNPSRSYSRNSDTISTNSSSNGNSINHKSLKPLMSDIDTKSIGGNGLNGKPSYNNNNNHNRSYEEKRMNNTRSVNYMKPSYSMNSSSTNNSNNNNNNNNTVNGTHNNSNKNYSTRNDVNSSYNDDNYSRNSMNYGSSHNAHSHSSNTRVNSTSKSHHNYSPSNGYSNDGPDSKNPLLPLPQPTDINENNNSNIISTAYSQSSINTSHNHHHQNSTINKNNNNISTTTNNNNKIGNNSLVVTGPTDSNFLTSKSIDKNLPPIPKELTKFEGRLIIATNCPKQACRSDIYNYFRDYNPIEESIKIRQTDDGLATGDVIIAFRTARDAEHVFEKLNHHKFDNEIVSLLLI